MVILLWPVAGTVRSRYFTTCIGSAFGPDPLIEAQLVSARPCEYDRVDGRIDRATGIAGGTAPLEMLSDLLSSMRLVGGVFLDGELRGAWSIRSKIAPEDCALYLP